MSENQNVQEQAVAEVANLKKLMDAAGITTFVPLSKVVGIAPQKLYSKKSKKTNDYNYDAIERLLVKEGQGKTIEEIVAAAGEIAGQRASKKAEKQEKEAAKEAKAEAKEKVSSLAEGMVVKYKTYRMVEGIKENYEVECTVKKITPETGLVILTRNDNGDEVEFTKEKAGKVLTVIDKPAADSAEPAGEAPQA